MASKSAIEAARLLCVQEDLSDDRVRDIAHTLESYANDRAKAVFEEIDTAVAKAVEAEREAIAAHVERYRTGTVIVADALIRSIRARGKR